MAKRPITDGEAIVFCFVILIFSLGAGSLLTFFLTQPPAL